MLSHKRDTHRGNVKRFKCNQCDAKFWHRSNFNKHVTYVHNTTERNFKCKDCDKSYKKKYDLDAHVKYKHIKDGFSKSCSGFINFFL